MEFKNMVNKVVKISKKICLVLLSSILLLSCNRTSTFHFYSPKKDQCISIIIDKNIRYIINGYHNNLPENNFVKIDISKVDRNVGDEVVGCWDKNNLKWIIMMNNVIIIDNKLDTTQYMFEKNFPVDSLNIPTVKDYDRSIEGCFSIGFIYNKLDRISGSIQQ